MLVSLLTFTTCGALVAAPMWWHVLSAALSGYRRATMSNLNSQLHTMHATHAPLAAEIAHSDQHVSAQGSTWSITSTHMMQQSQRTHETTSLATSCFNNPVASTLQRFYMYSPNMACQRRLDVPIGVGTL